MPHRLNVLYVEDNEDDVFLFEHVLRRVKPTVRIATNGAEAIDYLSGIGRYADRSQFPLPDVIFLDWKLPVLGGRAFLEWRRKTPPFDSVPVVVLVGSGYLKEIQQALELGATVAFPKPMSVERWGASLMEILTSLASGRQTN